MPPILRLGSDICPYEGTAAECAVKLWMLIAAARLVITMNITPLTAQSAAGGRVYSLLTVTKHHVCTRHTNKHHPRISKDLYLPCCSTLYLQLPAVSLLS